MDNYNRFAAFYKTASLWNDNLCGLRIFKLSQFKFDLDLDAKESLELPAIPHGTLLGKRAEYFFKFCVEQSTNYELVTHNLQIFKGKVTLGELDYILQDLKTGKLLHIELVYKFYIYDPNHTEAKIAKNDPIKIELARYVGPNRRDNLLFKLNRLHAHQLPLLYTEQAMEALEPWHVDVNEIKQQVCFLAHVFIPRELWQHDFPYINKQSIAGYYVGFSAFAKADTTNTYYAPEKHAWKMQAHALDTSCTFAEIVELTQQSLARGFAPLLWMHLPDGSFERFFVIKDS
ncbi:MAG: DUF1853 family protein [Nonlabens sp.]|nr:DUF1853 family protein [Nonlabens sp.]